MSAGSTEPECKQRRLLPVPVHGSAANGADELLDDAPRAQPTKHTAHATIHLSAAARCPAGSTAVN